MKSIVGRLKEYLEVKVIPVGLAEKEVGLSNGSLSKPFKAGTNIKTDSLEKFLFFYTDINPDWLLTGIGEMLINCGEQGTQVEKKQKKPEEMLNSDSDLVEILKSSLEDKDEIIRLLKKNLTQKEEELRKCLDHNLSLPKEMAS